MFTVMKKLLLLLFVSLLMHGTASAQAGCAGAVDLNINSVFAGGGSPYDPLINYGCVNAVTDHAWFGFFKVCQGGLLNIMATTMTSGNDADIVVWGPFSSTVNICQNLTAGNIAVCGNTGNITENVTLGTIPAGGIYMVAVVCDTNLMIPTISFNGTAQVNISCSSLFSCAPAAGFEMPCLVTVDSLTQEYKITWQELANPVSHYGILKTDYLGVPQEIDTVHMTSLSEYIDFSADPNLHTEEYALITYDTCGSSWQSSGAFIRPVFCQSSLSTQNTVNVSWTPYVDNAAGFGPVYYVIYRGASFAAMTSIDTVATFVNNYTDPNPLVGISYYKIGVALSSPCVPMRMSQIIVQSYSNASPITVVGMGENNLEHVSLFPNPSDGNITINNLDAASVLRVYDVTGRIVHEQQLMPNASQQVNVSFLENGMYSFSLENESGSVREEIVIRH
jgi:hypothetical protein